MQSNINYVKDTFAEYLGKTDHISASDLKNFLSSPRKYYYERFEKTEREEGRHFSIGSALHEMILEPELFTTNYVVSPKFDKRTKDGKAQFNDFTAKNEGKTLLFEDEMEMIIRMSENALKNRTLTELMKDSYRELSCYTTDPITGLKLKMRPDSLAKDKSTIVDIKSCVDSSLKKFKSDVYSYGYSLSAIEKQPPYQVALYSLCDEMVEYGRQQYRLALDLMKWSMDNNYWCNYNEFESLKDSYNLGNTDFFLEQLPKSELITIIY